MSPVLEVAFSDAAMAPDVSSGPAGMVVLDVASEEEGVVAAVEVEAAVGVAIIHVGLSVAITMVLTSSVEVGMPMVAGKLFIVDDVEVADPSIVAVMVRAVLG